MRVDNINMLNDTMAIMDRGYYEVNGKRVNLKLSEKERKEIFVFLPKDVKRISDNKDFQHVHDSRVQIAVRRGRAGFFQQCDDFLSQDIIIH